MSWYVKELQLSWIPSSVNPWYTLSREIKSRGYRFVELFGRCLVCGVGNECPFNRQYFVPRPSLREVSDVSDNLFKPEYRYCLQNILEWISVPCLSAETNTSILFEQLRPTESTRTRIDIQLRDPASQWSSNEYDSRRTDPECLL